jgi:RHS repeat-associated protein
MNFPAFSTSIVGGSLSPGVPRIRRQTSSSLYWESQNQKPVNSIVSTRRPAILAVLLLVFALAPRVFAQDVDTHNPIGVTGIFNGNVTTGCSYDPLSHSSNREITDLVVPGSIGKYPLKMTRYYNSRHFLSGSMGPGWSYEYYWGLSVGGSKLTYPNGNVLDRRCQQPVGISDWWQTGADFRLTDGGTVHFSNGVVTAIDDPYGQRTTIQPGNPMTVTEPGGRYLKFIYTSYPAQGLLLTRVEAHGLGNATVTDSVNYTYTQQDRGDGQLLYCLTGVTYSDNSSASYTYTQDNVSAPNKVLPLLATAHDTRYNGPMHDIAYDYQSGGAPHGAITAERYSVNGSRNGYVVSSVDPGVQSPRPPGANMQTQFTETRGDGFQRTFTYTELNYNWRDDPVCPETSPAPSQFLKSYTDFQGNTTRLGYDANWYVNSVTDANNHTTTYTRGPAPPQGIGQILTITHPGNTGSINYSYTGTNGGPWYVMTITDERSNQTVHTRDIKHRITRTDHKDSQGNIIAFEEFQYANNIFGLVSTHHLPSNTGWSGPYVHFQYDGRGLLIAKTNPTAISDWAQAIATAPKTTYTYYQANDPIGGSDWIDRVKTVTLPVNAQGLQAFDTFEYDKNAGGTHVKGRGLVTKIQHADGKYQSFGYDAYGNKLWEENELRKRTSYLYDDYNRVTKVTDPLQKFETFSYLKPGASSSYLHTTSSVYTRTSRTGIVTTNVYDENFRKKSTKIGSSTTSFGYDNVGNPTTVTDPLIHTTITDYDARNRKWHVWDALNQRTIFGYDPANNVTSITRPDNRVETKNYDAMNRLIRHTVPKSGTESLTTTFGYWPSGKLFWVKDPKQQGTALATYLAYNESDQMIAMYYPDPTLTTLQQWSYDDAHNLASRTTVGGKTQSFTYDIRNRKTGMSWSNGADPDWANFTYWDDGRLKTAQNANSTVYRDYDAAGRLKLDRQTVNGVGTAIDVDHDYDDDGKENHLWVLPNVGYDYTFSYDPTYGRFETIKPTGGSVAFKYYYDAASNEIHRDNLLNGGVTQIYNRDSLNRIWRLDVKKGANLLGREDYSYDTMNRLVSVTREDNKQDQFAYWFDGELAVATYGANPTPTPSPPPPPTPTPPGGQVAEPRFAPGGGNIYPNHSIPVTISTTTTGAQIRYTLDGGTNWTTIANNGTVDVAPNPEKTLTAIAFKSGMSDSDPHSEEYWYDNGEGPQAPDSYRTVVYYLDGAGNRTAVADTLLGNATYAPNDFNQYTAVTNSTITNGSEHEVASYQGPYDTQLVNYTYINDEHLKSVSSGGGTYQLAYDALGRCVKRTLNGAVTYYIYDGEKPILEYTAGGALAGFNVYGKGIDEILMRIDPNMNGGQPFYYQQDHEGSVTHLTNAIGNVIERYRYDVFGGPVIYAPNWTGRTTSSYNNRFLFTGREYAASNAAGYNASFSFYEYRARAYHPGLGRFMSEEPKLFDAGDYNLFRYCHNDPIDNTDPMGLAWSKADALTMTPEQYARFMGAAQWAMSDLNHGVGGAIAIGMAGYRIAQAATQMTKAITAAARQLAQRFVGGRDRSPYRAGATNIGDKEIYGELGKTFDKVSAANVPKMGFAQFAQFQRNNNTDVFYNAKWYHYKGELGLFSGKDWFGHEINYMAVGEGFAARGWSTDAMNASILARRDGMMVWNAIHGRDPGGIMGGEIPWALVGYSYYQIRSTGDY